jgi:hypothetical protein
VSNVVVAPLRSEHSDSAARVLARAFITNPLHIAAFGTPNFASNEAFFRAALAVMRGTKLVAVDGSRILGVIHWVRSPNCQFSGAEKLRMAPAMMKGRPSFPCQSGFMDGCLVQIRPGRTAYPSRSDRGCP